jgi:hypothetical protein
MVPNTIICVVRAIWSILLAFVCLQVYCIFLIFAAVWVCNLVAVFSPNWRFLCDWFLIKLVVKKRKKKEQFGVVTQLMISLFYVCVA